MRVDMEIRAHDDHGGTWFHLVLVKRMIARRVLEGG
jgi:hypothetical protein